MRITKYCGSAFGFGSKHQAVTSDNKNNGAQGGQSGREKTSDIMSEEEKAKRDAAISEHVYGKGGELPEGVRLVTPEELSELKLNGVEFEDSGSGFKSAHYIDENAGSYIYAFAGTDPKNLTGDLATNAEEGIGRFSFQHDLAVLNTETIISKVGAGNLSLTGHSLGGGLTSLATLVTGVKSNTFNAAGLHKNTIKKHGGMRNASKVNAYYVKGEWLHTMQTEPTFGRFSAKVGNLIELPSTRTIRNVPYYFGAAGYAIVTGMNASSRMGMHGIGDVKSALENRGNN
ncbi:hypothetical protein [Aliiglaciecola litoralis]|uniref:Lipase (Class 3) n=1 Tax=Aliiglaciecola litoralis TaxID=582857 RepID=A0ABP3WMY8_9ALTE